MPSIYVLNFETDEGVTYISSSVSDFDKIEVTESCETLLVLMHRTIPDLNQTNNYESHFVKETVENTNLFSFDINHEKFSFEIDHENSDVRILRFDFADGEEISLMKARGPAAECNFIIKKRSLAFYKEMADYMSHLTDGAETPDNGRLMSEDQSEFYHCSSKVGKCKHTPDLQITSTRYYYVEDDNETDLMDFSLIRIEGHDVF